MADYFKKLRGIIGDIFQLGKAGPNIKNNSGVVQLRNDDDSAFARVQGADPTADQDFVTRKFLDTIKGSVIVAGQADCSVSLPTNTATRRYVVVTTAGSGAVLGDLLYDDGSSSGNMTIVAKANGRIISVLTALSGGTISFDADSQYTWDDDGSSGSTQWVKTGDIASLTGPMRVVRYAIDNSASQDSTFVLPTNARVLQCDLEITTAYSGGATIEIGTTADGNLFMESTDNVPQNDGNVYSVPQDTDSGAASVVRTTVGNTPAAGAGVVTVIFTVPNV